MAAWLEPRLRPREGWALFILLVGTELLLVGAVTAANWVRRDDWLALVAGCAVLVGRWAGQRGWTRRAQILAGVNGGVLVSFSVVAGGPAEIPDLLSRWAVWMRPVSRLHTRQLATSTMLAQPLGTPRSTSAASAKATARCDGTVPAQPRRSLASSAPPATVTPTPGPTP